MLVSSTVIPDSVNRNFSRAEGCVSCWRRTTDERFPCGKLNDNRFCPDCAAAIAQRKDIRYMTYGKHLSREYEHRVKTWAATSRESKKIAVAGRCKWLEAQMRTKPLFSKEIRQCRFCGTEPAPRSWPAAFRCVCGEAYVVDRWFPDEFERVYRIIAKWMSANDVDFLRKIGIRP